MKKTLSVFISSLIVFCVLTVRYVSDFRTFQTGIRLLLPVWIEEEETDAFSSLVRIHYYNFIPVEDLIKESGTVIVSRFDDGQVAFVAKDVGQRLHPRELRLKYTIAPSLFFTQKKKAKFNVRFASSELRFFNKNELQLSAVRYAVVYVNDYGDAFLAGLTDSTGTQLIKGLAFSAFHTP